jgi:YHS domain-containing protein
LLVQRLELPLDDEEHMPPADKPQPSAQDVALLKAWIAAGAPFEGQVELRVESFAVPAASTTPTAQKPATTTVQSTPSAAPLAPPPAALEALRRELAHVQPVSQTDPLLWIDFAAPAADMDDARVRALLEPLVEHVAELSLARTKVGDATLELIARMPQLRKLDLRATLVTDAGARWLAAAPRLRELVAAQTSLGDAALAELGKSTSLERLVLWNSAATEAGIAALQAARPALAIESGALPNAAVLEAETEVKFTSDAPLPGAEAAPAALTPLNARCPVSDAPVNPKYAVVFEGKVIGFCCPNCPKEFWADPKAFAEKLK